MRISSRVRVRPVNAELRDIYGLTASERVQAQEWHDGEVAALRAPSDATVDAAVKALEELWAGTDSLPEHEEVIGAMYIALDAAFPALREQFSCPCQHEWEARSTDAVSGMWCPKCAVFHPQEVA